MVIRQVEFDTIPHHRRCLGNCKQFLPYLLLHNSLIHIIMATLYLQKHKEHRCHQRRWTMKRYDMVTVGVCTGPLPPAKPCNECTPLRKELQELLKRLAVAEAKPEVLSIRHTDGQSGDYGGLNRRSN
ncbi:hypothetical protein COOONC_06742, partial [Cooperia oncophora]